MYKFLGNFVKDIFSQWNGYINLTVQKTYKSRTGSKFNGKLINKYYNNEKVDRCV